MGIIHHYVIIPVLSSSCFLKIIGLGCMDFDKVNVLNSTYSGYGNPQNREAANVVNW